LDDNYDYTHDTCSVGLFLRLRKPLGNHGTLHLLETAVAGYSFTGAGCNLKLLSCQDFPLEKNQGCGNEAGKCRLFRFE